MEEQSASTTVAPGWFPDPVGRYEYRYFNGEQWTPDVSLHGARYVDPNGVTPGSHPQHGFGVVIAEPRLRHPAKRPAVIAFVFALAAVAVSWVPFLFVLGAAGAVAAAALGVVALRRVRAFGPDPSVDGRRMAVAALAISPVALGLCVVGLGLTRLTIREFEDYTDPGDYLLVEGDCHLEAGVATFDGSITNQDTRTRSYVVRVTYSDRSRVVGSAQVQVVDVAPGERAVWSDDQFVGPIDLRCTVAGVDGPFPFGLQNNN
jgi:hypothetical protein